MTQPDPSKSLPKSERAPKDAETEGGEASPDDDVEDEPEPWTPERVVEWNAYYDIYVALGVLLLAFVVSSNKITHTSIWNQLQSGRLILAAGSPLTTDPFSYTRPGASWVNVSWLFEVAHASLFGLARDMVPTDATDPIGSARRAEQIGAGTLVAVGGLIRLLTAVFLLRIRRSGPGAWWSALCVFLALGAVLSPAGVVSGGIAGPGQVSPGTWGILFLAIELWMLHRALNLGSGGSAFALVPLFVLWANVDESFLAGLMVLAAFAIGRVKPSRMDDPSAPALPKAMLVLVASALACLLNPSHVGAFASAAGSFLTLFRPSTDALTLDQLSYFGQGIRDPSQAGAAWTSLLGYYLVLVGLGFASFALNRRNFSLSRFLPYVVVTLLWGLFIRFSSEFAVVFAATIALNGQEWYHDRFGLHGRIGASWSLWSVGGRAVTIVAIFACVAKSLTGYGGTYGEVQFGFGYESGDFAFEAAEFLKTAPIQGNILNTTTGQGDALIWKGYPDRKVFNDSRPQFYPPEILNLQRDLRQALSEDNIDLWKAPLDEHKITAVMIQPSNSPNTYRVLSRSPNWIPFHDDGNVVLLGRADAQEPDLGFFKANRLDADSLAYQRSKPTPPVDRPPTPMTWMDKIFQSRSLSKPEPHANAAARWLSPPSLDPAIGTLPDPAHCLLAIREARTALSAKPDDTFAYRLLASAYRDLMTQESALLGGVALTPENAPVLAQIRPRSDLLTTRFRQRVTALNYAIQTTPPPTNEASRRDLQALNLELFQLFASVNFADVARDRLKAALDGSAATDMTPEGRAQLSQSLSQFEEQVAQVNTQMGELAVEQQYSNPQLAGFALSQGMPGLAIRELEQAERTGANPAQVKPQLLDLYCDIGQPDKAVELLSTGSIGDPVFGVEPGLSEIRQGRAYSLLGNPDYAATLWEKYSIPKARNERTTEVLMASQAMLRGETKGATGVFLEIPGKIAQQATWQFESGLARLEGGTPELASDHFTRALVLMPDLNLRPLIAYYLEKLGKPVPPTKAEAEKKTAAEATAEKTPAEAEKSPTP